MKHILTVLLCLLLLKVSGQNKVELDSVKNYNGKLVQVRGKVAQISNIGNGKDQQIMIYIGGNSPNEKLSVLLDSKGNPELDYLLKDRRFAKSFVIVTGTVELVNGKARIKLPNDQNLRFIIDEEVPSQ